MGKKREPRTGLQATMHDVAVAAGVSWITVSRALRHPGSVAEETRGRIEQAIAAIGYFPHLAARSLVSHSSHLVAALVPSISNPIYAALCRGLTDRLRQNGVQLILGNTDYDEAEEEQLIGALLSRRPEGFVVTGTRRSPRARSLLETSGIPVVETWSLTRTSKHLQAGLDNKAAQAEVTEYLVAKGFRRFAYVTTPQNHDRWKHRYDGFRMVLRDHGLEFSPDLLFRLPPRLDSGTDVVRRLQSRLAEVEVVVCAGDVYAIGIVLACRKAGIQVPSQLAVTGFGGFEIGSLIEPSLTTICVPSYEIGLGAGDLIAAHLKNDSTRSSKIDVGYHLVVGDSA